MNLKNETLQIMKEHTLTPEDIDFITVDIAKERFGKEETFLVDTSEFWKLADEDYDEGFGGYEVALSLQIVFKNGSWLERHEYDGSEWWEFKSTPQRPENIVVTTKIWDADKYE